MNLTSSAQRAILPQQRFLAWVNPILVGLILLDITYAVICLVFPQLWFRLIHGVPYADPQGLLPRTGAIWATFALLQFIALIRWRAHPYWIAIITGVRLSEVFADWTYLAFAANLTTIGRVALFLATPSNLLISGFFFWCTWMLFERGMKLSPPTGGDGSIP